MNADLQGQIDDLTKHFYIAVAVLSTVIFLVGVLCGVLYYWLYMLEQSIKKGENEEPEYRIRRAVIRDNDSRIQSPSYSEPPTQQQRFFSDDQKMYKNPLTNGGQNSFRDQLDQQLSQNNPQQRYGNMNDWNNKRTPRQSEQQLHQNFYGVDNNNFRY